VTTRVLSPSISFFLVSVCWRRRRRFPSGTCPSPLVWPGRSSLTRRSQIATTAAAAAAASVSTTSATVLKAQKCTPTTPYVTEHDQVHSQKSTRERGTRQSRFSLIIFFFVIFDNILSKSE